MPESASPASSATLFSGAASLPFDAEAGLEIVRRDRPLARMIDRIGPFALGLRELVDPFEALAEAIVYQQLTGKAAGTIFGRLRALSGADKFLAPEELLALPDSALRGAGISRPKAAALRDLARRRLDGLVPPAGDLVAMSDPDIVSCLTAIRGIGCWTVEMLLIFNLGRPDILPVADYGLRKGFMRTFGTGELPTRSQVASRGERWRPYRTVASWYLWRASELADDAAVGRKV